MSFILCLAYLFFIGSVLGWVLELIFRKFFSPGNPQHKWINPGFCLGPYVPLYGSGLCILYSLAYVGQVTGFGSTGIGVAILLAAMAISMTLIEYLTGIVLLKCFSLRLWDYSKRPGNVQGLICPLFSLIWAALGALYYFLVHPYILDALDWLANNLSFSFVIGYFFGVFTIDVAYSARIVTRIKRFAKENDLVVKVENLKANLHAIRERDSLRKYFFNPLHTKFKPLTEYLREAKDAVETKIQKKRN